MSAARWIIAGRPPSSVAGLVPSSVAGALGIALETTRFADAELARGPIAAFRQWLIAELGRPVNSGGEER